MKGFDPNTQLNTEDLQFDESKILNAEVIKFDGGSFITIVLIAFFTISVIVSSFIMWYKRRQAQKIEEERITRLGSRSSSTVSNSRSNSASRRQEGVVVKEGRNQNRKRRPNGGKVVATCGERFMKCFSIQDNLALLFTKRASNPEDSNLEILNGIRVMTLALVILGNTYFYILKGPL